MKRKIQEYMIKLEHEEKSVATRRQYRRDILQFLLFAEGQDMTKALVIHYKQELQKEHQPTTINAKLAALNGFFSFVGRKDLRVKQLKIQRTPYCSTEKELSKAEYLRLVQAAARKGNGKLSLILQTICGTGIRVSELRYITAEAVKQGQAHIQLKGKNRVVLLPAKLRKALEKYLKHAGIVTGPVFVTRHGKPLDRSNIWKMMKALCADAGVAPGKVFPHNLRHLFARCFYSIDKDIAKLADILGHSSVNTTRIYIISSGWEHQKRMNCLGLVV